MRALTMWYIQEKNFLGKVKNECKFTQQEYFDMVKKQEERGWSDVRKGAQAKQAASRNWKRQEANSSMMDHSPANTLILDYWPLEPYK